MTMTRADHLTSVQIELLKIITGRSLNHSEAIECSTAVLLSVCTDYAGGDMAKGIEALDDFVHTLCDAMRKRNPTAVHVVTDGKPVN